MRPINWLHISDIHLREGNEWSQDVVLQALRGSIRQLRDAGSTADFILVTGDIAFSGKSEEYLLAERFFEELQIASGVSMDRIFCIPGNHDIDRTRHDICFRGAVSELKNTSKVDAFLGGSEDLETLLTRQENFRRFQNSLFVDQVRSPTQDGLGYVSKIEVGESKLAILALDSAWLAGGGKEDHGRLLIGERQVINAIEMGLQGDDKPHVVLAMAHHPFHLLQEFDRPLVQSRLEDAVHFFHCGHLHEPENHLSGPVGTGCLTVAAGASYETRQSRHAYSMVKLDLLQGTRNVSVFRYNPRGGTYSTESSDDFPLELTPIATCSLGELAGAIIDTFPRLEFLSHYLAALVLGKKTEFPIQINYGYTFGAFEAMKTLCIGEMKNKTVEFMRFRNVLSILFGREPLKTILQRHGKSIDQYGKSLAAACNSDADLRKRLDDCDKDSRILACNKPQGAFSHTLVLLRDLAESREWRPLREQADRLVGSADPAVAIQANRMLALALANSENPADKEGAIQLYQTLAGSELADFSDIGYLAILLLNAGCMDDAATTVLDGIGKFPEKASFFAEIGSRIVVATGDRSLRIRIDNAMRGHV